MSHSEYRYKFVRYQLVFFSRTVVKSEMENASEFWFREYSIGRQHHEIKFLVKSYYVGANNLKLILVDQQQVNA